MATEEFEVWTVLPATAEQLYSAWLEGKQHAALTGAEATGEAREGASFTAWDGYIVGENLVLEKPRRIVQSWRTTEFPADAPSSRLEILFEEAGSGTRVVLRHSVVPAGQGESYRQGWHDHYFTPMKRFFGGGLDDDTVNATGDDRPAESQVVDARVVIVRTLERPVKAPALRGKAVPDVGARVKKHGVKKRIEKKSPAKKSAAKKGPAKKSAVKKAPAKKSAAKKSAVKKSAAKKAPAKKSAVKKGARKVTAKKPTKRVVTAARKKGPPKKSALQTGRRRPARRG